MKDNLESRIQHAETGGYRAGIQLSYPLESWIEQLLRKYPEELSTIVPKDGNRVFVNRGRSQSFGQ